MSVENAGSLRVDRIQGSVYPGFTRKDEQVFLWVRFPGAHAARTWLRATLPELTSARDVLTGLPSTCVNVAFSRAGLDLLMPMARGTFPEPFEQGMAARANVIGDTPDGWRFGSTPDTEAHALVILAADEPGQLVRTVARYRDRLGRHGARDLFLEILGHDCHGATLPNALRGREHFGYRDGISGTRLDGSPGTGEFVLGYPDATGAASASGPTWTRDGSYLVFRRLRQDVAGFHRDLAAAAISAGLKNRAQLGAKLFGRWPSGAKLGDPIEESDPGTNAPEEYRAAEFARDPAGTRVPLFSHVRKAQAHEGKSGNGSHHQLLRRGIPYGPPLLATGGDGLPRDDGRDRGLLFLAYQADLGRQYEHVQRWLNDRNLPVPGTGQDAIAGQGEDPARLVLRHSNMPASPFDIHHYVSMTGGGYFFTPSLSAVRFLANPTTTWEHQEATMGDLGRDLGDLIARENPYGEMTKIDVSSIIRSGLGKQRSAANPFEVRELPNQDPRYWQGFFWTIGTDGDQPQTVRVSKALRIRYTIGGVDYWLVVGYEGGAGM